MTIISKAHVPLIGNAPIEAIEAPFWAKITGKKHEINLKIQDVNSSKTLSQILQVQKVITRDIDISKKAKIQKNILNKKIYVHFNVQRECEIDAPSSYIKKAYIRISFQIEDLASFLHKDPTELLYEIREEEKNGNLNAYLNASITHHFRSEALRMQL